MSRKPKIDKRLDKLFKDIQPEENVSKSARKPKVRNEAPPPLLDPKPAPPKPEAVSTARKPVKREAVSLFPPETIPMPEGENAASAYSVNLQVGEQNWATLRLLDEGQNRRWTTDEQLLIKQVTDQLALALENARLFQETQKRAQEMEIVNQVVSSVSGSLDLKSTLQNIATHLAKFLSAGHVGIAMMNADKSALVLTADASASLESSTDIGTVVIPIHGNPATEEVLRSRKPLFIRDVENNPLTASIRDVLAMRGTKNLLVMPLLAANEVIGTIGVDFFDTERTITQDEIRILETIVYQTATAIQTNRLFERVEQSETNLRTLFSAMEDVVLVMSRDGRYDQIAPTNPSLLIRTPSELLGKYVHEVLPRETADYFLVSIQKALIALKRCRSNINFSSGSKPSGSLQT
jgi:GAF domain-containing protein